MPYPGVGCLHRAALRASRVLPTIQTAAEAVTWTFQVAGGGYHQAQET